MPDAVLIAIVATTGAAWLIWKALAGGPRLSAPYLQFEGDNSAGRYWTDTRSLLKIGYAKYLKRGMPFAMYNSNNPGHPQVVLPLKYLEEVRNAPESKLSFPLALEKTTIIHDIGGPKMTNEAVHVVRFDVNRALPELISPMQDECLNAYRDLMPPCQDWTPMPTYQLLLKLFSRITARTLVGPELCENREWLDVVIDYTNSIFKASHVVRAKYNPRLRCVAKYIDPVVADVYKYRRKAGDLLRPVLEARKEENRSRAEGADPRYVDGVQWLLDAYRAAGNERELTPDQLAQDEFVIIIASIHSSAATALSILYDLMDRRDLLAEIEGEITRVRKERGARWTRRSLGELRILDSFMKEIQRVHQLQQLTLSRMAVGPFSFKDGFFLPGGTQISMPNELVGLDPDLHSDAETFDTKRWLRKREETDPKRFHFASVSDDLLPFGSGKHACPGRFLAQEVMKLMFVYLLTNYELKYPDGADCRPPDTLRHHNIMPDVAMMLLLKEKAEQTW